MNLSSNISSRRSVRQYKEGAEVSKEQVHSLLEAAMHAPSACNTRPWEFIVIRNRELLNKIADNHPHAKMLSTASLAILVCALPEVQSGISDGFFPQDCGAATQNILLQAAEMELGSCWCGVYPKEPLIAKIKEILNLPENSTPFNIIAIGVADGELKQRGFYEGEKVRYMN